VGSGWVLRSFAQDHAALAAGEHWKGGLFVVVTAILLGVMLDRHFRQIRRSARMLEASEAGFRALFEYSPEGVLVVDAEEGRILAANGAMHRMLGYRSDELSGRRLSEVQAEPESPGARALRDSLMAEPRQVAPGFPMARKDGSVLQAEVSTSCFETDGRRRMVALFRDITERTEAEEQSRIKHDLLQALSATAGLEEGLRLCLDAAIEGDGLSCGGLYLFEPRTRTLELCVHRGLSDAFVRVASRYDASSPQYRLVQQGRPVYSDFQSLELKLSDAEVREGLHSIAAIPITHQDQLLGCLNVAAHHYALIPSRARVLLETIAAAAGQAIARLRAQEALRESEKNFRSLFQTIDDLIVVATIEGRIRFGNRALESKLGFSGEELVGMTIGELHPPEVREEAAEILAAMSRGERQVCPLPLARKDGTLLPVETRVWLGQWDGEPSLFGLSKDLSAEQEAQQRFERLFRLNPLPMALSALPGRQLTEVNDAWLGAMGYERAEVIGRTTQELGLWCEVDDHDRAAAQLESSGSLDNFELRVRSKDGGVRHGLFSGEIVQNHGKSYLLTVMVDLTERKEAETVLRRQLELQRQLASVAASVPGMICSVKRQPDGGLSMPFVTTAIREVFGLDPEDVRTDIGPALALVAAEDRGDLQESLAESARTLRPWQSMFRVRHPQKGEIWVEGHSVPQSDPDGSILWHGFMQDVTERRRSNAALEESRRHLATLMANLPGMAYRCQNLPDWPMVFVSEGCAALTGFSAGRLMTNDPAYGELILPEDRSMVWAGVQEALQNRRHFELTYRLVDGEGRIKWVWERGQGILSEAGELEFLEGFISDISERKQVEEALRASEDRYRLLVEESPDGVGIYQDNRLVFINSSGVRQLGASHKDELLGRESARIIHPDDHPAAMDRIRRRLAGDATVYPAQVRYVRLDGTVVWVEVTAALVRFGGKDAVQFIARDITERRRAEEALRHSEERFRHLVETTCDWIWEVDADLRYTYASPKVIDLLGYTPDEVLGRTPLDLMPPAEAERVRAVLDEIRLHRRSFSALENLNVGKDGRQVVLESSGVPVLGSQGELLGYRGMDRDISERKRLESQLRQAQKLEAVGQLAGGVAHDFNNILAAVMMHLGLIQMNPALDGETLQALKELDSEARRAASLTRQLLMFSRRSVLSVKPLDVNEVVANLLKMLGRLIGEQIALRFERGSGLPAVMADAGMVEQVLLNLAVNARDAMPEGGRITISTNLHRINASDAAANPDRRAGTFVCLSVSDTGCGMDETIVRRVFEPFFTTKEAGKGTGLGLATVHGIAAQHKGWVEVESAVGEGSTFRVFLPAVLQTPVADQAPTPQPVVGGRETLLLVEDDTNVRRAVGQTLRSLGYRTLEAANGQEAMRLWQSHGAEVDLLLTDMVMPEGLTGLQLGRQLRQLKPGLKIIISSGYSSEFVQEGMPTKEGILYLPKPYASGVLAEAVRKCLDGQT